MNHRHLLPNEIDLLVDGEAGFGVAPLRAHILECSDCRERLDDARVVVTALEALPHFAPDSRLADRIMAQGYLLQADHDNLIKAADASSVLRAANQASCLASGTATCL